jgi:hypothetical protein
MNTGIQDAQNLAWKLALVVKSAAPAALLDSYEAERRPVGMDVLARTRAASEGYGRERGRLEDERLVDTQVLVAYRDSPIVRDDAPEAAGPQAGERAPDVAGLRRQGMGFPVRLFEELSGYEHVVVARLGAAGTEGSREELEALAAALASRYPNRVRVVAVADEPLAQGPGVPVLHDAQGTFAAAYGPSGAFIVRPDGYLGWRGGSWGDAGLQRYFAGVLA